MTQTDVDPIDAAMTATAPPVTRTVFGEIQVDAWHCILVQKQGKVPFDPTQHSPDMRRTAIDFTLIPTRGQYNIERKLLAESNEWVKIVMPSLKALNMDLRSINNKYVQAELVPTGRKYKDKNSGEEKEYTTLKFTRIFPDLETCTAEGEKFFGRSNGFNMDPPSQAAVAPAAPAPDIAAALERATAEKFIKPLWDASGGDVAKFLGQLANNPVLVKHFPPDSPEVRKLIYPAS